VKDATSIRNVNLLYLAAFLALLAGSILLPDISLGRRVVVNELAFLGLPLAVYLLVASQSVRETLRLRGVSWQVAGLSLLVGAGLWRFDWWLAASVNEVLGYTIPLPPEALNVTALDKIAMGFGTVVLAPVVEELLFRGALQSAYERHGPVRAIAASTLLFVMIHQELAQSFALLPVGLALGYAAWRTGSTVPAILVHLGNNAQAVLVSFFEGGRPRGVAFTPSTAGGLIGGLMAVAALWLLTGLSSRPGREPNPPRRRWLARNWLGRYWPLIPVVPIYAAVIGIGVLFGIHPEALAFGQRVELTSAPWKEGTRWTYEVLNALEEPVGEAECSLMPQLASFLLDCSMEQSAYEADAPSGFFKEGDVRQRQVVRWDRRMLELVETEVEGTFSDGPNQVTLNALVEDGQMTVHIEGTAEGEARFGVCYDLPRTERAADMVPTDGPCRVEDAFLAGGGFFSPLMVGEWPWRLSALPFELAYSREATLVWPYRSAEGIDGRSPARQDGFVVVRTAEQVSTPAGEFVTWRVTVGETYTAWYTVEPPHHLVAYSDDMVTWRLKQVGRPPGRGRISPGLALGMSGSPG
jgi:membrane protease YdiL (CAAX protease family)